MNSELNSIHVLILCSHVDTQKYDFRRILSPFTNDLSKLESDEGVPIYFGEEKFVLRASLMSFCGDGLAVHEIYNHLCPSANLFCRLCLYTRANLHATSLEKAPERTEQIYNEQLELLRLSNHYEGTMTATGIKGPCVLNDSRYFHISRNKVFDIIHDLLCGICPMVIKLVLHQYIIIQKIFSVQYFNGVISAFNYGYVERKNKPSANFTVGMLSRKDHTLCQKAAQMWCLTRTFPFLLSEKVQNEDEYMDLIIYLLRIMEIVFAPKI